MQNKYKFILLVFLLASTIGFSQVETPPTPGTRAAEGVVPPGLPIDGGLSILLAAGAFYGIKKSLKR